MDPVMLVDLLSRWTHVGSAIVLLGGSVFTRFVLMPAAGGLPATEHAALRERILSRWKKFVLAGIVLLLVSGFSNFVRALPSHRGDGLYHSLMGVKILLALGAFFLASVLTGRAAKFESLRANSARWLSVLILVSALVVAIGGLLKVVANSRPAAGSASALHYSAALVS